VAETPEIPLEHCPFCDGARLGVGDMSWREEPIRAPHYVGCGDCGVHGPVGETNAAARRAWNHRAEADRLTARAAAAEAEAARLRAWRDNLSANLIDKSQELAIAGAEVDRLKGERSEMACPECKGEGRVVADVGREDDEVDCPICEGAGSIAPEEYLASNRLARIREILGAQDVPYQTEISAAHGAMHRVAELTAERDRYRDTIDANAETLRAAESALAKVEAIRSAAWKLATYADEVHWSEHETNTAEYLEGLRERIDAVRAVAAPPRPRPEEPDHADA
jgi:Lar family restriction alleviation protein